MKTLIFVYSPTTFHIDSSLGVKQFQPGKYATFADTLDMNRPATGDVQLDRGIYMIHLDGDDVRPDVTATTGTRGTHYDTVTLTNKDKWPEPPSLVNGVPLLTADEYQQLLSGIRERMEILDTELGKFTETLSQ